MNKNRKILLHACCAPCATVGTSVLTGEGFDVSLYFYGGNIHPFDEWSRRLDSLRRLAEVYSLPLIVRPYDANEWDVAVAGFENEPERGARCVLCMKLQLEKAACEARRLGISTLTTSLTLSPQKPPEMINDWGRAAASEKGLAWEERIWRKKGGVLFSVNESKRLGLYRQNYCGCRYSFR